MVDPKIAAKAGFGNLSEDVAMVDENHIVTWTVRLEGHPFDLSMWEQLFHQREEAHVTSETGPDGQPEYHLRSSQFSGIKDTQEVQAIAVGLVSKMSGAVKILDPGEPVRLGPFVSWHADGKRGTVVHLASGQMRIKAFTSAVAIGSVSPTPPRPSEADVWMTLADADDDVADALRHFARSDDWLDFYKTLEVLERDLCRRSTPQMRNGRELIRQRGWATRDELRELGMTMDFYRHHGRPRPEPLLTSDQARDLLRRILRCWLEEKQGNAPRP
jgi:hypothetical protein